MLTNITNTGVPAGYSGQQVLLNQNSVEAANASEKKGDKDKVTLSDQAQTLKKTYEEKEDRLEQNYVNEALQLEREYLQEKIELQREFKQKQQNLGINIFA